MTKISFVITGLAVGGAEMMLLKLLAHLDPTKFQPQVISLTSKDAIGQRIEALGIPVIALGMQAGGLSSARGIFRLIKLLRQADPDIVQTWMYHADLLGGIAAKLSGVKCIAWSLRNSDLSVDRTKPSTRWVVRVCRHLSPWIPKLILSCSEQASQAHIQCGYMESKIHVIPNGFDLERFVPDDEARRSVRHELGLPAEALLVGLIARWDPQKNHLGFIAAAKALLAQSPDVHFLLAGTGIDANNQILMKAICDLDLAGHFHLLGRRDDVPRLMASLDLLASTSLGEAFPNVLGEAMACQVPCVVTDVGDCKEIVGNTGKVVANNDMQDFAHQMHALLSAAVERSSLGLEARQRIETHYDIKVIARKYEKQYSEMMESA